MTSAGDGDTSRISLLGPAIDIQGNLTTNEELVILGRVSGDFIRAPLITIGPRAEVRARIHARRIRIEGVVVGEIHAEDSVMIQATATVSGLITCPSITIRDGASVNGGMNLASAGSVADSQVGLRGYGAAT